MGGGGGSTLGVEGGGGLAMGGGGGSTLGGKGGGGLAMEGFTLGGEGGLWVLLPVGKELGLGSRCLQMTVVLELPG